MGYKVRVQYDRQMKRDYEIGKEGEGGHIRLEKMLKNEQPN